MSVDDWRQVEFVARLLESTVRDEIGSIQAVVDESTGEVGFGRVHVRTEPRVPLAGVDVSRPWLEAALPGRTMPLGFVERPGLLPGAFALRTSDGLVALCDEGDGQLFSIGFERPAAGVSERDATAVAEILRGACDLVLVNWCRRRYTTGPVPALQELLS